ncbi:hypothetical protein IH992_09680 [Candidatus Poribacteria bacterium]|nr:hypothetical protein [Candidatus Poribacteria bacterium]
MNAEGVSVFDTLTEIPDLRIVLPQQFKEEIVDEGKRYQHPDAFLIEQQINNGKITVEPTPTVSKEIQQDIDVYKHLSRKQMIGAGDEGFLKTGLVHRDEENRCCVCDDRNLIFYCFRFGIITQILPDFIESLFKHGKVPFETTKQMLEALLHSGRYRRDLLQHNLNHFQRQTERG